MDPQNQHDHALAKAGIVTREALMAELNIRTKDTIREWERQGLPSILQGQQVLYHVPAVVKWLLRRKRA